MFKKMLIAGCGLLCVGLSVCAETYELGDGIVKDGIPCIVISVDESGQHGVAMSCIPTQKALRKAKKNGDYKWFWHNRRIPKLKGEEKWVKLRYRSGYYSMYKQDSLYVWVKDTTDILGSRFEEQLCTSVNGKENMQNVMAYCNDNEISMEEYFPEFYWGKRLAMIGLLRVWPKWKC